MITRIESAIWQAIGRLKGSAPPVTVQESVNRLLQEHDVHSALEMDDGSGSYADASAIARTRSIGSR